METKKNYTFEFMQISKYISDLLFRYDCVVVPNFGAFLAQKVSAEIHPHTDAFYPPKKRLSFNVQLQSNDGVLANHIAVSERISYENALAKIDKQVNALKVQLRGNEALLLEHIGTLQLTKTGELVFEPTYHLNYLTESFGLSQFVSPAVSRVPHLKITKTTEQKAPIGLSSKKRKTQNVFKYAAVAVIMLGLVGFFGSNTYLQRIERQNILAQEEANMALDNKIQEATFVMSNPLPAVTLEVTNTSGNFHIVAGHNAGDVAKEAANVAGVSGVLHADGAEYANGIAENLVPLIVGLADQYSHIFAPATTYGKNIMPGVAALKDVAQISDIIRVESADTFQRPIYQGQST